MSPPPSKHRNQTGIHPDLPQAVAHHQAGRLQEARQIYERILAERPVQFDAQHLLGVIAMQEGRFVEAQDRIRSALKIEPTNGTALGNLAAAYLRGNQFEQALAAADQALRLDPESVDALINAGTALYELGRYESAVEPLSKALDLAPRSILVLNLIGACHLKSDNGPSAVELFQRATSVAPEDADSWSNLSSALTSLAENERALECAERAVALRNDSASTLGSQAAALFELGKVDEAIGVYRQAMEHAPSVEVLCAFANALLTTGLSDEARIYLERAIENDPGNAHARWILAISNLKPIYQSTEEIEESRRAFSEAMAELKAWYLGGTHPYAYTAVGASQPFFIAYQEYNNRTLLKQYGDLCATFMSSYKHKFPPAVRLFSRTPKMRIGIASAHIREHSVWTAITKGWVYGLDRSKFELFLFHLNPIRDEETAKAQKYVDHFENREKTLAGWASAIRSSQLDFLIYPEIGMDSLTYQLASQRLAPRQAVTWGHPETSGIPTIDFYLSGEALEPGNAQDNYSETLIKLPNLGIFVEALEPKVHEPNFKSLGLPRDEPLLLCPGTSFKYLPTHDSIWIDIARGLEANGSGRLVFFLGTSVMYLNLLARLRKSFAAANVDFERRVCISPLLDRPRFFGLMQKSTLLLDTIGFSGVNTALQALECGLPVLAYEGKFMRGRLASGVMRTAGMPELVAQSRDEFVRRAVELASDRAAIKKLRNEIPKRRRTLFRDMAPVRALAEFLEAEIKKLPLREERTSRI